MPFDAETIFEQELSQRGIAFEKDGEDRYRIKMGEWKISASLENVRRNAERDEDPDAIRRFVDHLLAALPSPAPSWSESASFLFWSAESADGDFADAVHAPISDEVSRVLTLTDRDESQVTWVTPSMCEEWAVTTEQAAAAASANQDRLLAGIEIQTDDIDGEPLGMVPLASPYKASVIFAGGFRRFVEPALGWPVLVVVPCRDFIYVLRDGSPLLPRVGSIVVDEFRKSGYPITTEVLRLSDDGIKPVGRFRP
jgi:hypothetical protein